MLIVVVSGLICAHLNIEKDWNDMSMAWLVGVLTGALAVFMFVTLDKP